MNFFVSVAVGMLVVFQAFKMMGPLPEKIHNKVNTELSVRERNLQAAMADEFSPRMSYSPPTRMIASAGSFSSSPNNVEPVATPIRRWPEVKYTNKPLMTFERYIAHQKKLKKHKRAVASAAVAKKGKAKKYQQVKKPALKRNQKVASSATRV
ncbi:hypothetical protein [Bdellovibrio sp. KM01]|uniref:hypothetical protein n=1 Tax=Bdellovibrio sp. KM01 TaxID=2748865 RepID=UPI0015EAE0C4|nr:hypothetical protein [Bdellovibrio sp. KM01]QLY27093.1 hypothetical protein HW988_08905 [Bdellovibrio sp. KM01]